MDAGASPPKVGAASSALESPKASSDESADQLGPLPGAAAAPKGAAEHAQDLHAAEHHAATRLARLSMDMIDEVRGRSGMRLAPPAAAACSPSNAGPRPPAAAGCPENPAPPVARPAARRRH